VEAPRVTWVVWIDRSSLYPRAFETSGDRARLRNRKVAVWADDVSRIHTMLLVELPGSNARIEPAQRQQFGGREGRPFRPSRS